ncbi:hypothetical protein CDAR_32441 [Caerostris darwini]|uniref:Uncharacterized protein n=1 Tax=Caerostris darwini TaxID=1538125 RepID=A0AAV4WMP6_9ARAC|nr:hypothetical protein CDAR_32441 [Caerostris darwini]
MRVRVGGLTALYFRDARVQGLDNRGSVSLMSMSKTERKRQRLSRGDYLVEGLPLAGECLCSVLLFFGDGVSSSIGKCQPFAAYRSESRFLMHFWRAIS